MTIKEDRPERIVLEVDAEAAGPLVVLDLPYPGWKVTIDGEPAEGGVFEGKIDMAGMGAGKNDHDADDIEKIAGVEAFRR